jgi:hypothetical protein
MTQVFADDDQVADRGMFTRVHIPMQPGGSRPAGLPSIGPPSSLGPITAPPSLGPAMVPGKGVRRIRCVGCAHETLPRNDDGAPLCQRCSELLAAADAGIVALTTPVFFRAPRWFRRRTALG